MAAWIYDSPTYRPGLVLTAVLLALLLIDGGAILLIVWWLTS